MLSQLTIRNFGLIDNLSVDFHEGLNVLTGATGAGKSILIDAIQYSLGKKINPSQIRDPRTPCVVETVFEFSDKQIEELVFPDDLIDGEPVLIINRSYSPNGRNKNKINGFSLTTSRLKELGNKLIDIHGPHDHQMLFSEEVHLEILDHLSGIKDIKNTYTGKFRKYTGIQNKLNDLKNLYTSRERELDLLKHQIRELEQVALDETEYEKLLQDQIRVGNSEKLFECVNQIISILESEQSGVSTGISKAFNPMNTLSGIDPETSGFLDILSRIQEDSSELLNRLNDYARSLSFDPGEADDIKRRYDIYYDLLRKYGPDIPGARDFYDKAVEKYALLADLEHNDKELKNALKAQKKDLLALAAKLTRERKRTALTLKNTIEKELKELGISNVKFECRVEKTDINQAGTDKVTFYISPNLGEDLKPLADIASGGEAARVMLALKKALTKVDPVPVLIFDEIDAQIGGRLGSVTGKKLKELSLDRQIILITHLPQIAAFSDWHLKVDKITKDKKTVTTVNLIEKDQRIKELAHMMSGEETTGIAHEHAKELIKNAK
jgi:DNA repair protein RecN (Recombination protein N)